MAATRLTLLIIEEIPKQHLIIDPEIWKLSSGEATSGFWSRTFFFLLGPIFYLGYDGVLKTEGLMSLGIEFSSARLFAGLSKRCKSFNQSRRHSLLLACCWEWKGALCAVLIPRVILSVLTFSQPISIQKVVEAIEDESIGNDESGRLVAAVTLTFAGSALCRAVSKHMTIRLLTRVRGGLLSVLLDKNMKLRLSDARKNAIVTLMSADFDGIANGLPSCVEIPITFLETGLGMFLLTRFVQQSSFVIIFPLIFATLVNIICDIAQLPGGVDYVVGSGGLALSGGQRQRVSMARATYCRAKLMLLDDSFSALDRMTATAILFNLCGENGLLRQSNTAVVIVSYLPECLEIADNIIYLDGHGNFSHQTSQASKALSSQILSLLRQEAALEEKADAGNKETTVQPAQTVTSTAMQRVEDTQRKQGDKALYRFWLREIGHATFATWLCIFTIHGVLDSFPRVYMKIWVDNAPGNRLYFIGYALLPFVCGIFCFTGVLFMFNHVGPLSALGLHQKLAKTVMLSTLGFLSVVDSGSILNMFGLDMDILTKCVPPALHNTLYYGIGAVVKLGIISAGAAYMTLLIPPILLALVFIQRYSLRTSRHLRQLELESQAPLVTAARETSDGLVYIRGFGWGGQTLARAHFLLDRSQKPVYLLYASQQVLGLSTDLVAAAMAILLTVLSLYIKHGRSANSVGVSFLSIVVIGSTLIQLVMDWTSLEMTIGALSRIRSFVAETPIESGEDTCSLPEDWPSRGEVQLENVSARYRNETGEPYVVRNVTAPRDELRARIVTISQDQVELDGTVRDNLLPFDTRWDDEAVTPDEEDKAEAALKDRIARETLVRLRIWDKVESKGGLTSMLEDVGYSHGEMQLLCIARAVVRRRLTGSNLLLVDEATGGVDRWRDQIVREMMKEYFRGCTIIVVAHREESIADSNVTVEMANGEMKTPRVFY
ncbi:hypothetical protein NHJ13734_000650 [Beauveria thailandica]